MQEFHHQAGRALAVTLGALTVAALAAGAWWATRQPAAPRPPQESAAPEPVPVIVYLVDTLRADRLEPYGYPRPTSPALAALAAESVLFEQAYAAAPWTLPSVASLATSTFACENGLVAPDMRLDPRVRTLAERMKSLGYATGAYYSNFVVGPPTAIDRGYDVSEWRSEDDVRAGDVRAFLDRIGAAPPFLYLHTMEPHQPYLTDYGYIKLFGHVPIEDKVRIDGIWQGLAKAKRVGATSRYPKRTGDATQEIAGYLRELDGLRAAYETVYDASVREADDHLRQVIDVLKERGVFDRALFIVLADHGEEFGEHGAWFHEESLYEAVTHVPLIVRFPGGAFAGRRVKDTVSLVDVAPTILDFLGRPELCDTCRGRSLMGLVRGEPPGAEAPRVTGVRINVSTFYRAFDERRGEVNVAVRRGATKAILNEGPGSVETYDLAADPGERRDLSATDPATARQLQAKAASWLRDCRAALKAPDESHLDERTQERLRALGYAR